MTTTAPQCALLTAVIRATLAGRPAYTVLDTVLWRGDAAPPFEPPASRAAAGTAGGLSMGFENVPLLGFENVPLFRGDRVPAEGWVDGIWRAFCRIGGGG